jgi:hypothetical protein
MRPAIMLNVAGCCGDLIQAQDEISSTHEMIFLLFLSHFEELLWKCSFLNKFWHHTQWAYFLLNLNQPLISAKLSEFAIQPEQSKKLLYQKQTNPKS